MAALAPTRRTALAAACSDADVERLGNEMRACGAEAITLLVQLVHGQAAALPPWARDPARRIVARYHRATDALGKTLDTQARDYRR